MSISDLYIITEGIVHRLPLKTIDYCKLWGWVWLSQSSLYECTILGRCKVDYFVHISDVNGTGCSFTAESPTFPTAPRIAIPGKVVYLFWIAIAFGCMQAHPFREMRAIVAWDWFSTSEHWVMIPYTGNVWYQWSWLMDNWNCEY